MNYSDEESSVIRQYLIEEFPDYSIREQKHDDSYGFRVSKEQETHYLRVMFTAIDHEHAFDLRTQLDQYAVSITMRSLGDFPVVVTESGCIFGSP